MTNCGQLSKNLALTACVGATPGVDKRLIFLNFDDIDRDTTAIEGNVCSKFVMKDGKKGFSYSSEKNSWEAQSPLSKGTYKNRFDHSILGRVFLRTQAIKDELIALSQAKVVVIVENADQTTPETHFEIYGYESGLVLTDLQSVSTDADGVIYSFTAASSDNSKESQLPLSFFETDLETTRAAVESLINK